MGVYLPLGYATQGPAPDGFHVPLQSEWQAVYNVWVALGGGSTDGTNFGIAFKLPFAGSRNYSSSNVGGQGSYGRYWSASSYTTNAAYNLNLSSSGINPQNVSNRAIGFSVRCFKNSPVIATSSWTKLYGTSIEAGGIFWSSTDGLISLSSDGQTWITIQDKNLGATNVYNNGDILSETNCGKYYQRGNNYGFPRTGSVTTSGTQVDASNYGPGNYYNSNTFITGNSDRSSVQNDNLRGGVDGNVPTMSELKNAYIGEYVAPIDTPGIYHNATLGLISLSSDGSTWITIADKNLGATQVWNEGDTLSEANCGKFYQWGNNYGFPFDGTFNKSSTKPNASGYVSNYSNSTFITTTSSDTTKDWSSATNNNLWGGEGTTTQRKGPCATGFHIPTNTELNVFRTLASMIGGNISNYIKMPVHRYIMYSGTYMDTYPSYYFWTSSTQANPSLSGVYNVYVFGGTAGTSSIFKTDGHPIRPFKNEAVQPDSSRTKLY